MKARDLKTGADKVNYATVRRTIEQLFILITEEGGIINDICGEIMKQVVTEIGFRVTCL